jgi:hypothetical protein
VLTVCVIRMCLFGTWQMRILEVIPSPGTHLGQERLGCPAAAMGTISGQLRAKPAALFGLPADTHLGLARDAKNPHR